MTESFWVAADRQASDSTRIPGFRQPNACYLMIESVWSSIYVYSILSHGIQNIFLGSVDIRWSFLWSQFKSILMHKLDCCLWVTTRISKIFICSYKINFLAIFKWLYYKFTLFLQRCLRTIILNFSFLFW